MTIINNKYNNEIFIIITQQSHETLIDCVNLSKISEAAKILFYQIYVLNYVFRWVSLSVSCWKKWAVKENNLNKVAYIKSRVKLKNKDLCEENFVQVA